MTESEYPKAIYLARISEKTGNYEEAIKYIEKIINMKSSDITKEERNILQAAFKHIFSEKRSSWRTLCNVLDRESRHKKCNILDLIKNLKIEIENEIIDLCNKLLKIIDEFLLNRASTLEAKVFYLKLKGDYNRYMIDFSDNEKKKEKIDIVMNCYNEAFEYCKKLPFTNDVRLGLVLNFGVFFNDILNDPKNALNVTNDTYNALIKEIDNLDDKQYNIINPIANLIKENIDNWNSSVNESNKEVNNVKIMEYA